MKTKFSGILTLLLAFVVQFTFAQEKTISGTVTDESGLPLPAATVLIQGTTNGTSTDFDGNYTINASVGDVLQFSYVGYATQSQTVGASNTMDASLEPDNALDEVVVTALGIKREKREVAYQTEIVDNEKLVVAQPTTAASALTGKVAGLQINNLSNGVKSSTKILLRGLRSISSDNSALIVIDGSIATTGAFDALNPNDIEDLNVLKGATAAALYGSRAGNGAIIVTTKKGDKGEKFTVGLNSTTTFEQVAYMPDFQTEYGTGWQGVYDPIENTNWGPRFDGSIRQVGPTFSDGSFQTLAYAPVKNNLKDFYNTGTTYQNSLYFSGSDETSSYYVSLGDQRTTGIVPNDQYKRNTVRLNASKTLGKVTLSVNSSYFRDDRNIVGGSIGSQNRPLYWFVLNTPANIPLSNYSDWQNDLYSSPDGYFNGYYQNPYWAIDSTRDTDVTDRIIGNIAGSWQAYDWLNITARFGLNKTSGQGKEYRAEQNYTGAYTRPSAVTSFVTDSEFQSLQYTSDLLATGEFDLTEDISFKAILGATNFTSKFRNSSITANNISIPGFYDISNGTGQLQGAVNETEERNYGFFGDLTFGYKNFLFLNLTGRQDYTSTLPKEDNSYFYPGIGLSFVATDAFPSLADGSLDYLKITANNSTVYNDLNPYQINEGFNQPGIFPFGSNNGFALNNQAVAEGIKKEKLNTTEFGLNARMFNNRLRLTASYFKTILSDLITSSTTPNSAGSTSLLTNIGEMESDGFEVSLGGTVLKSDDFSWDVDVNFSSNKTVVNDIGEGISEIQVGAFTDGGVFAILGEEYPQIKGSSYERDPNGNIIIDPSTGNPIIGDLKNLGKTTPDYVIGLISSVKYKGFTLSTTMDYRTGHVYYSQIADSMEFTGRSLESVSSNRQDFVVPNSVYETSPGSGVYVENTNIAVTGGRQSYWTDHYNNIKENYVQDATAVKMRELALNYNLPSSLIDNTPVSKISVGFVARNLFTWLPTQNRFSDPEFNNSTGNAIGIGGYFQSPPTKTFGLNINVEF